MSVSEMGVGALQQDVAGVDAAVRPEHREAGLRLAHDQRPVDRAATAVPRKQRRVVLDRAVRRSGEELRRDDERDEGHDLEVRREGAERLHDGRVAERSRADQREPGRFGGLRQRVRPRALRGGVDRRPRRRPARAAPRARPCRRPAGRAPRSASAPPRRDRRPVTAGGSPYSRSGWYPKTAAARRTSPVGAARRGGAPVAPRPFACGRRAGAPRRGGSRSARRSRRRRWSRSSPRRPCAERGSCCRRRRRCRRGGCSWRCRRRRGRPAGER